MSIGGARLKNGLTEQLNKFVEFYLESNDATASVIKAGYAPGAARQRGTELLNRPAVKKVLDMRRSQLARKTDITREYVLDGLKDIFECADKDRDKISAACEINKMCGFNAPVKSETDIKSGGKELSAVVYFPAEEK